MAAEKKLERRSRTPAAGSRKPLKD